MHMTKKQKKILNGIYCRSHHKETLKRHMFIHSEDPNDGRKHICNICHKTWYTKTDLKEHLMVHAGIKPYKCKLCNSAFSNFSGHRQHMMKTVRHYILTTLRSENLESNFWCPKKRTKNHFSLWNTTDRDFLFIFPENWGHHKLLSRFLTFSKEVRRFFVNLYLTKRGN